MIRIALDTNLIDWKGQDDEVQRLESYHRDGIVQICVSERALQETENHIQRHVKAKSFYCIGEPFTIGQSRIGSSAYISSGAGATFHEIREAMFPNFDRGNLSKSDEGDVMHIAACNEAGVKYFVTRNTWDFIHDRKTNENRDGEYLDATRNRLRSLGTEVMTPHEMLAYIKSRIDG